MASENDPFLAFETALRIARADSHSRRLDSAVQTSLASMAQALALAADALRVLAARVATLEAKESMRVHADP